LIQHPANQIGGTMADTKLRWGILGCARITRRGLIPGIRDSQSSMLQAIGSRNRETAESWAAEFGVPNAHGSYQQVLDDPDVDAIYIPLPNELHKPWILAAANAGKHVLCEKPLALDTNEASTVLWHCRQRDVILMEAFMWRHQPRTLAIRRMVLEGAIGQLRLIRASFSFPMQGDDWRLNPKRGGGALWDVGCYGVSTARLFAGTEPQQVQAFAHFGETGVDLSLAAALEFPGEVSATIDCSFEQPFRCFYELVGTQGVIEVPDAYLPPADGKPSAMLRTIGSVPSLGAAADEVRILEFEPINQFAAMVDAFARSASAGKLEDPAEDGLDQMVVLDQLLRSAKPV
jgi:D-xylose 1-dehydrogenase (NADP+, D-xylono-1,5-lactone-forming)